MTGHRLAGAAPPYFETIKKVSDLHKAGVCRPLPTVFSQLGRRRRFRLSKLYDPVDFPRRGSITRDWLFVWTLRVCGVRLMKVIMPSYKGKGVAGHMPTPVVMRSEEKPRLTHRSQTSCNLGCPSCSRKGSRTSGLEHRSPRLRRTTGQ